MIYQVDVVEEALGNKEGKSKFYFTRTVLLTAADASVAAKSARSIFSSETARCYVRLAMVDANDVFLLNGGRHLRMNESDEHELRRAAMHIDEVGVPNASA